VSFVDVNIVGESAADDVSFVFVSFVDVNIVGENAADDVSFVDVNVGVSIV
jgi:hypothetical protein